MCRSAHCHFLGSTPPRVIEVPVPDLMIELFGRDMTLYKVVQGPLYLVDSVSILLGVLVGANEIDQAP